DDSDAAKAYQALCKLVADPEKAVPLLRERLRSEPLPSRQELAELIGDLNSGVFAKREAASRALEKLGATGELALTSRLDENMTPEMRRRVEEILHKMDSRKPTVAHLRVVRALEALE